MYLAEGYEEDHEDHEYHSSYPNSISAQLLKLHYEVCSKFICICFVIQRATNSLAVCTLMNLAVNRPTTPF